MRPSSACLRLCDAADRRLAALDGPAAPHRPRPARCMAGRGCWCWTNWPARWTRRRGRGRAAAAPAAGGGHLGGLHHPPAEPAGAPPTACWRSARGSWCRPARNCRSCSGRDAEAAAGAPPGDGGAMSAVPSPPHPPGGPPAARCRRDAGLRRHAGAADRGQPDGIPCLPAGDEASQRRRAGHAEHRDGDRLRRAVHPRRRAVRLVRASPHRAARAPSPNGSA